MLTKGFNSLSSRDSYLEASRSLTKVSSIDNSRSSMVNSRIASSNSLSPIGLIVTIILILIDNYSPATKSTKILASKTVYGYSPSSK